MIRNDIYTVDGGEFFKKTRTVFIYGEINSAMAYDVCWKLKYLDYIDSDGVITVEINSPGGEVASGLSIIATMKCISAPVKTVVCGRAASMAALIAASGTPGKRYALPYSEIMIHQPLGGLGLSQASDIANYANNIVKTKRLLNEILAKSCKKSIEEIAKDTERDHYLDADEAVEYGLIDEVVKMKKE